MLSRIEQLERLYEEEDQRLEACYDDENDLYGAVICTIARIAAGCNCVKHDLRAILKQNVEEIEPRVESDEHFCSCAEE